jgi:hypothetical protein
LIVENEKRKLEEEFTAKARRRKEVIELGQTY